jgi:hypothetical protein
MRLFGIELALFSHPSAGIFHSTSLSNKCLYSSSAGIISLESSICTPIILGWYFSLSQENGRFNWEIRVQK